MTELMNGRIAIKIGDITKETADAIVNAANSSLMGGGGVDGAIHRAGGPSILAACKTVRKEQYPDGLPTGQAVVTTAGNLPARYVIHTVGPVWHDGKSNEKQLLDECYRNSLRVAAEHRCKTIAFPAISTGIYRFPKKLAAKVASSAVKEFLEENETIRKVVFVFFSPGDAEVFLGEQVF